MLEAIRSTYDLIDQLHLTMTGLIAIVVVLAIAFLFAVREAASWFFKVDDIKRDVRKVQNLVLELEGEMKVLQELLANAKKSARSDSPVEEEARLVAIRAPAPEPKAAGEKNSGSFPIVH